MQVGYLGELVFQKIVKCKHGIDLVNTDTRDYDFTAPNGLRVEVKTKKCTSPPRPTYDNSVCSWNTKQKADVYVFLRVQMTGPESGVLYFTGTLPCGVFRRESRLIKKGDVDPSNGFRASATHKSMRMGDCFEWGWLVAQL
jgi:hypothetical protein